jgi:hypothetical protein
MVSKKGISRKLVFGLMGKSRFNGFEARPRPQVTQADPTMGTTSSDPHQHLHRRSSKFESEAKSQAPVDIVTIFKVATGKAQEIIHCYLDYPLSRPSCLDWRLSF